MKKKASPSPPTVSNATVNREIQRLRRVMRFLAGRYRVGDADWSKHNLREPDERVREASDDDEIVAREVIGTMSGRLCQFA